jgi:cell division protein FtsB
VRVCFRWTLRRPSAGFVEQRLEAPNDARPAAEQAAAARAASPEAEQSRRDRIRRRLVGSIVGAAFAGGLLAAVFGEGGLQDLRRLQGELAEVRAAAEFERQRLRSLEEALARLERDPDSRERIARELLGLVRPDEVDFLLPPAPQPAEPPSR